MGIDNAVVPCYFSSMWPGKKKKNGKDPSITQSKSPGKGLDNVWACIRRMNARLDAADAKLNVVQTMAMRTEKKVYREKDIPATEKPVEEVLAGLPPGLFGGM